MTIQETINHVTSEASASLDHYRHDSAYWPMENLLDLAKKQVSFNYLNRGPRWEKLNLLALQALASQRLEVVEAEIAALPPSEAQGVEVVSPLLLGFRCSSCETLSIQKPDCQSGWPRPEAPCVFCGCVKDGCESQSTDCPVSMPSKVSSSSLSSGCVSTGQGFGEGGDLSSDGPSSDDLSSDSNPKESE